MSLIDNFFMSVFSTKIGEDQFGNKYYQSKKCDYLGQVRRQVIYKGFVEATKIPPLWHAWLHYMIKEIPNKDNKFTWQEDYVPNLTGTKLLNKLGQNNAIKVKYNRWKPSL